MAARWLDHEIVDHLIKLQDKYFAHPLETYCLVAEYYMLRRDKRNIPVMAYLILISNLYEFGVISVEELHELNNWTLKMKDF